MGTTYIIVYVKVFGSHVVFESTTLFILNEIEQIHNEEINKISQDNFLYGEY